MRKSHAFASLLALAAAVVRTVDGQDGPLRAARESALDPLVIGFFHLTWYMVTAVFVLAAIALLASARSADPAAARWVGRMAGALFLTWSALIAAVGMAFGWEVATIIPLVVTVLIGVLSLTGAAGASARRP